MRPERLLAVLWLAITIYAQPQPLTPADYGQFESLGPAALSPDGKWLFYSINRANRNNELRVKNIESGDEKVAAFGAQPAFSSDSRWIAYSIGVSEAQEEKLQKEKKPLHRKLGLLKLATGDITTVDGISSFAFSPDGAFLAMRRYPPEKPPAPTPPAAPAAIPDTPPAGATLMVRQLATGRDVTFGNVAEFVWQDLPKTGRLLALTISIEDKTGNGVQLLDPQTGSIRVLDSGSAIYTGLSWRRKSTDLSVLRSQTDEEHEGATHSVLAWRHLGDQSETNHVFDPKGTVPAGSRTVAYRKPSWSDDGEVVFLGVGQWDKKLPEKKKEAKPASESGDGKDDDTTKSATAAKEPEDPPSVEVWHWRDTDVMPKQRIGAKADRERNLLAAWHLTSKNLVPLATVRTEEIMPIRQSKLAAAVTWTPYAMERSIGRPAANLSLIDVTTGERTSVKDNVLNDQLIRTSPGGKYVFYVQDDHYWTVNTKTREVVNITEKVSTSFIDKESDFTQKQKPPFGVAGWTKDDAAIMLYDKFDLWHISPDGKGATKLTNGASDQVRHRYMRLDPDEEFIDPAQPIHVSTFGVWSKKSGYGRIVSGRYERLLWDDGMVSRLMKARDAQTYAFTTETFERSPNFIVARGDLKDGKTVTNTNPFQSKYLWGRSELIEYKNSHGQRLQGALSYPAGFEAGKKYPLIVYLYEKLSDNLHRYMPPSERDYYSTTVFNANGYFVLRPDIVFKPREPGVSVADCITAAVKAAVAKGDIDVKRIGVVGHSWGGFDASYLATHTNLFAAAVAGAPITNLVSNYGNHHWTSGIAETDHIETGQQRMEVPLWEDLPAYIRNSAVFNVHKMTTPLLIEVGDIDGTVFYHQGVELYNIARRAGKNVVLLLYAGEDHGLRKRQNQIDYTRRIIAWFGHYLKAEPGAAWITEGESYLQRQQILKELKATQAK